MRRYSITAAVSLATVGLLAVGTMPAAANGGGGTITPVVVAEHLAGPLTFGVGSHGSLYVGQSFAGALTQIKTGQAPTDLVSKPGVDVAGVSVKNGTVTWAETTGDPTTMEVTSAVVKTRSSNGTVRQIANTLAYEKKKNPDRNKTYGFQGLSADCLAMIPPFLAPAKGGIDSHPYGTAIGKGVTYLADAGANAILKIDKHGIHTVAVLPGKTITVTSAQATANQLPPCVVGHKFTLEPVPTDVEIGHDGYLYVTSLPGGPEDGSLGANGSVYRVNPWNGHVKLLATGFAGATGLAIGPKGTIYVAELFGNKVSSVSRWGKVRTVVALWQPAAVEWANGQLYVSDNALGDGRIVRFKVH
jgi:hypothetical protein